jgi:membrane protein DedA with SNARE-associated domain
MIEKMNIRKFVTLSQLSAVPPNTLVLFGSYGIVPNSEMFVIQKIASALIAGVVVVVVDWKRLLRRLESGI